MKNQICFCHQLTFANEKAALPQGLSLGFAPDEPELESFSITWWLGTKSLLTRSFHLLIL